MIIKYLNIYIFILFSFFLPFFSQNMSIYGSINDTLNRNQRKSVVMLIRLSDSVLVDFQRTNENGEFYLNVPMDTVEILFHITIMMIKSYFSFLQKIDLP